MQISKTQESILNRGATMVIHPVPIRMNESAESPFDVEFQKNLRKLRLKVINIGIMVGMSHTQWVHWYSPTPMQREHALATFVGYQNQQKMTIERWAELFGSVVGGRAYSIIDAYWYARLDSLLSWEMYPWE